jgi:hypothetical protein
LLPSGITAITHTTTIIHTTSKTVSGPRAIELPGPEIYSLIEGDSKQAGDMVKFLP